MTTNGGIATIVHVFEFNVFFARTVQHHFMHVRAQAAPRRFDVELIVICQRFQHLEVIEVAAIPASDRTASQRQFRILDHAVRIEILLHAKAVTGWAGPRRVVKRKQAWFQFTHTIAANWAGEVGGK